MAWRMLIGCLCSGLLACVAVPLQPKSANPYEPSRTGEGATGGAAPNALIAAGASVHRRLEGECYVPCLKGTVCNVQTGLCDTLPCHGECKKSERCDETGLVPRCVPDVGVDLQIETAPQSDL